MMRFAALIDIVGINEVIPVAEVRERATAAKRKQFLG
jgi:hypothetical protein